MPFSKKIQIHMIKELNFKIHITHTWKYKTKFFSS